MPIKGKVIAVGRRLSGVSKTKGTPWEKQEYVIETEGQYPKKVAFSILNNKIEEAGLQIGHNIEIEVDAQSREYNGKWYTELTAWRVKNYDNANPQASNPNVYQQQAPQGYTEPQFGQPAQNDSSNMPF